MGIAEVAAFNVGKQRSADKAQFFYAPAKLFYACADILLRQRRSAFNTLWILRAVFGEPSITRARQGGGKAGVFQRLDDAGGAGCRGRRRRCPSRRAGATLCLR